MTTITKKVHVIDDIYACVKSDGQIFLGQLDPHDQMSQNLPSVIVNSKLEDLQYSLPSSGLKIQNGDISISRNDYDFTFTQDNFFSMHRSGENLASSNISKALHLDCNAFEDSPDGDTLLIMGDFQNGRIQKGTVITSWGQIDHGYFNADTNLDYGIMVHTENIKKPDDATTSTCCSPVVVMGDFSNNNLMIRNGVLIQSCGSVAIGKFEVGVLKTGTLVDRCVIADLEAVAQFPDVLKDIQLYPHISCGVFEEGEIRRGVDIEHGFVKNIAGFLNSNACFTKKDITTMDNTVDELPPSTMKVGKFAQNGFKGVCMSLSGDITVGIVKNTDCNVVSRGLKMTSNAVTMHNMCSESKSRMRYVYGKSLNYSSLTKGLTYSISKNAIKHALDASHRFLQRVQYNNGTVYYGFMKRINVQPDLGMFILACGHVYIGQTCKGKRHGHGIDFYPNGKIRYGVYDNNQRISTTCSDIKLD